MKGQPRKWWPILLLFHTRSSSTGLESLGVSTITASANVAPHGTAGHFGPCLIHCWAHMLTIFPSMAIEPSRVSHGMSRPLPFSLLASRREESQLWHLNLEPCFSRPLAGVGSPGLRPQGLIEGNRSSCTKFLLCADPGLGP